MNLPEAIQSGKNFKHQSWPSFIKYGQCQYLTMEQILDNNWEIEEEKIEITRTQLEKVLSKVFPCSPYSTHVEIVLHELGFI